VPFLVQLKSFSVQLPNASDVLRRHHALRARGRGMGQQLQRRRRKPKYLTLFAAHASAARAGTRALRTEAARCAPCKRRRQRRKVAALRRGGRGARAAHDRRLQRSFEAAFRAGARPAAIKAVRTCHRRGARSACRWPGAPRLMYGNEG
jgi:hypothetical protein